MPSCKQFKLVVAHILMILQIQAALTASDASSSGKKPEFVEPLPNITVAVGRDATLPCVVKHLQDNKVAFVHIDRQMILTIHNQVITRISRFSITYDNHLTWNLHIKDVQKEDKGFYMCQVNADPMVSSVGYLDVVVPPNIIDAESSASTVSVRENHNASLICKAEGTPQPTITWRREDNDKIILKRKKKEGKKEKTTVQGETLDLIRISRTEMGAYLCIAQNGVPPSISKRIILTVEFSPMIWIPNMLVGAPLGSSIKLECHTESSPRAITYWMYNDTMVLNTPRHQTSEQEHSKYKLDSSLVIKNLTEADLGPYKCISKNSLGETEGTIILYKLERPTEPPRYSEMNPPISVYGEDYSTDEVNNNQAGGNQYNTIHKEPDQAAAANENKAGAQPRNDDAKLRATNKGDNYSSWNSHPDQDVPQSSDKSKAEKNRASEQTKAFWNRNGSGASQTMPSLQAVHLIAVSLLLHLFRNNMRPSFA